MLSTIALVCAIFTILVTAYGAFAGSKHGGQSMRDSMIETWTNIVVGFSINYAANMVFLPMAEAPLSMKNAFLIGVIYTALSIVRSFLLRRWYNWKMVRQQKQESAQEDLK